MNKVLVTGANGFIGRNILTKMIDANLWPLALIRSSTNVEFLQNAGIQTIQDSGDPTEIRRVLLKEEISGVLHLASYYCKEHKDTDIQSLIESNIALGLRILQASLNTNIKWFLNTGTFWQNFNNESYSPVNLYAASKQAFEDMAKYFTEVTPLKFVTLALNDTFGPYDTRAKIFNLLMNQVGAKDTLKMSGGEQIIDISYIDDVCDAFIHIMKLLESNSPLIISGDRFALHSPERKTLKDIVKDFELEANTNLKIEWGALPYRTREVMSPWKGGKAIPGWSPKYTFRDGVAKIIGMKND